MSASEVRFHLYEFLPSIEDALVLLERLSAKLAVWKDLAFELLRSMPWTVRPGSTLA